MNSRSTRRGLRCSRFATEGSFGSSPLRTRSKPSRPPASGSSDACQVRPREQVESPLSPCMLQRIAQIRGQRRAELQVLAGDGVSKPQLRTVQELAAQAVALGPAVTGIGD